MHNLTQGITFLLLGSFEITRRGIKQKEERRDMGLKRMFLGGVWGGGEEMRHLENQSWFQTTAHMTCKGLRFCRGPLHGSLLSCPGQTWRLADLSSNLDMGHQLKNYTGDDGNSK